MYKKVWLQNLGYTILLICSVWVFSAVLYNKMLDPAGSFPELIVFNHNSYALHLQALFSIAVVFFGIAFTKKSAKYCTTREKLIEQEENYRLLTEHSNDVIWKMDKDRRLVYVSPSIEKLRGFTPEEVMNQPLENSLTKNSVKTIQQLFDGLEVILRDHPGRTPSVITEIEQPCKDGSTVWVEASIKTVLDSEGRPDYFIGVSRDITERKRKEQELRRSEEYYRLMAETSMDFIIVHDLQGKIIFANPSGIEASGYSSDEIIGMNILEFITEEYQPEIQKIEDKRESGDLSTFRYETEFYTKNGDKMAVEISSAPIMINRTPISIMVTARDISERKRSEKKAKEVEERIRKINAELEEKVKDRTRKLEETNSELESFSYSVSHDLHAPLRHISTFSGLLKQAIKKGESDKTQQFLDAITSSAEKMKDLINSLLQLSRTGRSELIREEFEMKQLIDQVIREVELDYSDKEIKWKISVKGKENADIRLMKQVWYNLIANAVKFTNGNRHPEIEIGKKNIENREVWFIKDNGVGFDPKHRDKLFGVFQRLHSEEDFEGSGIGLATVKRIITKHEGSIWAESSVGKGATFYFYV